MTFLGSENEAEILRLAFNEEWPIGTIAKQLGMHRSRVVNLDSATAAKSLSVFTA